jgi:SH3-like domain-containing protein
LTGNLESGEQVEVLGERLRWAQVRSASGRTGWVQSRFLAGPEVRERFRVLAEQSDSLPPQGTAIARREANLHLEPDRDAEAFYRLPVDEMVEVLAHRVTGRASVPSIAAGETDDESEEAGPPTALAVETLEDWLLVRGAGERTGWLLESLVDLNPPVEVAQYREGQRIRAWFVLHREMDDGVERPWYLWATIRRVAGLPYDFDEVRVFVWNPNRDRYETSYRERNLIGFYPIRVASRETPGGPVPSFVLPMEDETGKRFEKQYVMAGRIVQRAP